MKIAVKDYNWVEHINVGVLDKDGYCTHKFINVDESDYYASDHSYVNSYTRTYCNYCGELLDEEDDGDYCGDD